jgi:NTP pyrophosphatase (non-canonical NTP hydrolase)
MPESKLHLKEDPTLADLQQYMREMVKERGFKDDVAQRFVLLMEEMGELAKASRKHAGMGFADDTERKDLENEAADVLIVFLGLCNLLDIDLEKAFRAKEERNKQRVWKKDQ